MKKLIITLMLLPVILFLQAQPDPALNTVFCPGTTYTFHYTLTGSGITMLQAVGTSNTGITGSQAAQIYGTQSVISNGATYALTFTGSFTDYAAPQGIEIDWRDDAGHDHSVIYHYDYISSYRNVGTTVAVPQPSPITISAPLAQLSTSTITVPTLKYVDDYVSPKLQYGSITNFQFLLPSGWKLGSTVSDGVTWINGTSPASVTSDACTGGTIQIRGATCATGLTTAPIAAVNISRPAPTFTIGSTSSAVFCTGDTRVFSVNSLPPGATVAWSASPTGVVTINSPSATTTTLTRTGSGIVTLTAAITVCGNTYTATSSAVTVGSPAPTDIVKGPGTSGDVEATCTTVPGATSYNWTMNGTAMTGQNTVECDLFPVNCKQTVLACVSAVNACGTSAAYCESVTNTPCLGGGAFVVSPNPASSSVNISIAPNTDSRTLAASKITSISEVRLYDQQGNLRQRQQYRNAVQASMDVSKQPAGTYFIEIVNGTYVERQMFLIRK